MPPDEYRAAEAASSARYHSLAAVPATAFPLFLSSREYLLMLDATTPQPFFRRRPNGAIAHVGAVEGLPGGGQASWLLWSLAHGALCPPHCPHTLLPCSTRA